MKHIVFFLIMLVLSLPVLAQAQDPHDSNSSAEGHYQTAVRLYGEGRYREALDEFDAAIEIAPQAVFYCNRALPLIKLQETGTAVESLRECLKRFEGKAEERAQIDAQMNGVATYHQQVRITAQVVARDIAAGPVSSLPPQPVDPEWGKQEWGLISAGAGVALLGGAFVLDLTTKSLKEEFIEVSKGGDPARYDELHASLETRQTAFWILSISGAVAVSAGIALILWPDSDDQETAGWIWAPTFGSDSLGATGTYTW